MFSKIYLGLLAVSTVLVGFFTYYSWSWLQSIGLPSAAVENYIYHDGIAWLILLLSSVGLLLLANVILWTANRAWALWVTLLYFSIFILLRYFWIDQTLFAFKKANGLWEGSFSIGPLFGAVLVIVAAVFIFFDHFALIRLRRTMYPPIVEPEDASADPDWIGDPKQPDQADS